MTSYPRHTVERMDELTQQEKAILDFEVGWWKHQGAKEQAVRDSFDITATRYFQLLNALVDKPAALAYAPTVVRRVQRTKQRRRMRPATTVGR